MITYTVTLFTDGTSEYLKGSSDRDTNGVIFSGLPCATVLIGVFDRTSGKPVAGVVNQPFSDFTEDSVGNKTWVGKQIWGVAFGEKRLRSCDIKVDQGPAAKNVFNIAISRSETEETRQKLISTGAVLYELGGVGYKLLKVIDHTVDFYILSKSSCFKWDTCAAHAILCSMGGGVVSFCQALQIAVQTECSEDQLIAQIKAVELVYHKPDREDLDPGKKWSNSDGLIAFRSYSSLLYLLRALSASKA